jgi:hypothetical protein
MQNFTEDEYQKHLASVAGDGFVVNPPGYERLNQWTHVLMHIVHARANFELVRDHPVNLGDLNSALQLQAFLVVGVMAYGRCYASSGSGIPMLDSKQVYHESKEGMYVHKRLLRLRNTMGAHANNSDLARVTLVVRDEPHRILIRHRNTVGRRNPRFS